MLTVVIYIILTLLFGDKWSGWLFVLPVLFDIVVIERLNTIRVNK